MPAGLLSTNSLVEFIYDSAADGGSGAFVLISYARLNALQQWPALQYSARVVNGDTSGSISWYWGTQQKMRINADGDCTLQIPTNGFDGSEAGLAFVQNATGTHTLSFASGYIGPDGTITSLPDINTAANSISLISVENVGGVYVVYGGA